MESIASENSGKKKKVLDRNESKVFAYWLKAPRAVHGAKWQNNLDPDTCLQGTED